MFQLDKFIAENVAHWMSSLSEENASQLTTDSKLKKYPIVYFKSDTTSENFSLRIEWRIFQVV